MRNFMMALSAAGLLIPATMVVPTSQADAHKRNYRHSHNYAEWRGRDGRTYCRRSNGTTGLIVGGVGGALVGRAIDTGGDRTIGTLGGAALGALAGREIERSTTRRRCR